LGSLNSSYRDSSSLTTTHRSTSVDDERTRNRKVINPAWRCVAFRQTSRSEGDRRSCFAIRCREKNLTRLGDDESRRRPALRQGLVARRPFRRSQGCVRRPLRPRWGLDSMHAWTEAGRMRLRKQLACGAQGWLFGVEFRRRRHGWMATSLGGRRDLGGTEVEATSPAGEQLGSSTVGGDRSPMDGRMDRRCH
jgi:hypothetical protein